MKAGATGIIAIVLTATLVAQTGPGRGTQVSEAAQVQRVRVAIGHGNVPEARRLADAIPAGAGRDLGSALVDIFEGKDEAARPKLEPLANVNRLGDAALELGLLELRHGQRRQGEARLEPIVSNRTFAGPTTTSAWRGRLAAFESSCSRTMPTTKSPRRSCRVPTCTGSAVTCGLSGIARVMRSRVPQGARKLTLHGCPR